MIRDKKEQTDSQSEDTVLGGNMPSSLITLHHGIHTLDNQALLPAGTVLSAKALATLISHERTATPQTFSLLRYGTIREDLLHCIESPPFNWIFDSRERIRELLALIEPMRLILPVLQSLDYFKKHDFHTYRHTLTVSSLSTLLVRDLLPDHLNRIRETATGPAHDFGKICIPLEILKKPNPLTRTERAIIEHHAAAGYVLLTYYLQNSRHIAARVSRDHHERKDGSGYPRGIRLADKIVEIVAVCDVYDALISPRPYRPREYENRAALEEISAMAERKKIGWDVVRALIARVRRSKPHYRECYVSRTRRCAPPAGNLYGVIAGEAREPKIR